MPKCRIDWMSVIQKHRPYGFTVHCYCTPFGGIERKSFSGSPARNEIPKSEKNLNIINRVRMNIPSSGLAVLRGGRREYSYQLACEGVDGNIHTNWLGI